MKKSILLVTVLSVALSSVPAMAENPAPFHAVSQLSMEMEAEGGIRELDVAELAQVEGGNPLAAVGVLGGLLLAPAYAFGYYVVGPLLFD
jgi:lactobin A/cerein 7B family class IIb bacteriocin